MLRATLVELYDGLVAEPLAGKGRLVAAPAARYDAMHAHCETLVVGGGPLRARGRGGGERARDPRRAVRAASRSTAIRVLERTTVVAIHDGNYVLAVERGRRLWRIRAQRIVLATGALERPPVFPDNDRPGLMLAGAVAAYGDPAGVDRGVAAAGARACISGARRAGGSRWDDRIGAPVPDGELAAVECVGRATGAGLPDAPPFALPDGDEDTAFVDLERDVDRRRHPPRDRRRPALGRARQALHDDRHRLRPGQDRERERDPRRGGAARRPPGRARHDHVPPALHARSRSRSLAGRDRGALFDPVRVTPIHPWHVANGAVMENVGQWHRPRYFPRDGETMDDAVLRECARGARGRRRCRT